MNLFCKRLLRGIQKSGKRASPARPPFWIDPLNQLEDRTLLSGPSGFGPAEIRRAYGIDPGIDGNGSGQTIAIVDLYDDPRLVSSTAANFNDSDLHQFDVQFGLPDPPNFTKEDLSNGR